LIVGDPNGMENIFKYAALSTCSLLALLLLDLLIGWLFHRDGRYRPEVAAVIVAPLAALSGWVVGLLLGHPTVGAATALPVSLASSR
jgi:hypothetical protein